MQGRLRALTLGLQQEGYMVRGTSSGASALQMAAADPPDLILLDTQMSDIAGVEVCRRLKADEKTAVIPVIFIGYTGSLKEKMYCFAVGGADYIWHPFQLNDVLRRVTTQIQLHRQQQLKSNNEQLPPEISAHHLATNATAQTPDENAWQQSSRILNLLTECNHATLQAIKDSNTLAVKESDLLQTFCRMIVEIGGYKMAWVGIAINNEEKEVLPVAQMGYEDAYLDTIRISWGEGARGQGPTGRAIRTQRPAIMNSIDTNPTYALWRETAVARGYASSIALPLYDGEMTLGALNIYAIKPEAFDADETKLLMCLANNLTFGLLSIQSNQKRQLADTSMHQLSQAVEQSPATIIITDINGCIEYSNPQFSKITGYSADEALGENPRLLKSGHTSPEEYPELWRTISSGDEWHGEFHNRKKNGDLYWESAAISPITNTDGVITHYLAIKEDITARKQMEGALKRRNNELTFINYVSHSMIAHLDTQHILSVFLEEVRAFLDISAAMVWMIEDGSRDLVCTYITEPYQEEAANWRLPAGSSILGWALRERKSVLVDDARRDPRFQHIVDYTTYPLHAQLTVPLQCRTGIIGAIQLVDEQVGRFTESNLRMVETLAVTAVNAIENARLHQNLQAQFQRLKNTQTQLIQSEKLAAIGELISGIAHELNNPLASIILYAQLMEVKGVDDAVSRDLKQIVTQSRRASNVVHGLLDFARQRPSERTPIQINDVLKSTIDLLAYELRTHNITVETNFSTAVPITLADGHQLQQVFVNLINNALHAMTENGKGGRLTLTTNYAISLRVNSNSEKMILIIIQDDGAGIPQENASRIFDPFFTTKAEGKGTGLGLALCNSIITEHQGRIWMESEQGRGATFFIELPVTALVENRDAEMEILADAANPANKRILVVDDEASILMIMTRILYRNGFMVDGVKSGAAALKRLQQETYDLIITDLQMLEMGGQELYRRTIEKYPAYNSRFIFITGDAIDPELRTFLVSNNVPALEKPFSMDNLIHTVKTMFL